MTASKPSAKLSVPNTGQSELRRFATLSTSEMIVGLTLAAVLAGLCCVRYGSRYALNELYLGAPREALVRLSLREAIGLTTTNAQFTQDLWVMYAVYPDVRDGFFVDVGSADGVLLSNSRQLEHRGWHGLCVDPFPTNMESRTCKMLKEVVYSKSGQQMEFRVAGVLGGLDQEAGTWQEATKDVPTVSFTTTTLDDILTANQAPAFIHYVSLDIEGAELEALRGWTPEKYRVGAFTIEHNFEEPKRTEIKEFLEALGYRRVRSVGVDDWYVLGELPASQIEYAAIYRYFPPSMQ